MAEDLTKKIKIFFSERGYEALIILRTPNAGKEVDNDHGMEFNLSEYAVIYTGDIYRANPNITDFELEEKTTLMLFDANSCRSINGIVNELKEKDDYQITYKSEDIKA